MTTPEQQWDGPIQDAIRRHDEELGHRPASPVAFFLPPSRPNGGGTIYAKPSDSGNPDDTAGPLSAA